MKKRVKPLTVYRIILAAIFLIVAISSFLSADYSLAIINIWLFTVIFTMLFVSLYKYFDSLSSPFKMIKAFSLNNPKVLPNDIKKVLKAGQSKELHISQHKKIDKNSTQAEAYHKIYEALDNHTEIVLASLNTIDYVYYPDGNDHALCETIHKETEIIDNLAHKLNELDNVFISIDSSCNEDENVAADELIQSLKEML